MTDETSTIEHQLLLEGRVAVITVTGVLDAATAPEFESVIDVAIEADVERIVLDFAHVTLLCSAGVNVVMRARQRMLHRSEIPVVVIHARGIVERVLTVTGVHDLVTD